MNDNMIIIDKILIGIRNQLPKKRIVDLVNNNGPVLSKVVHFTDFAKVFYPQKLFTPLFSHHLILSKSPFEFGSESSVKKQSLSHIKHSPFDRIFHTK